MLIDCKFLNKNQLKIMIYVNLRHENIYSKITQGRTSLAH
jgi:hypothetical protein